MEAITLALCAFIIGIGAGMAVVAPYWKDVAKDAYQRGYKTGQWASKCVCEDGP